MIKTQLEPKLQRVVSAGAPSIALVREVFDVGLVETGGNPHWRFLEADRPLAAWSHVELRLARDKPEGLLILRPALPSVWTRTDVAAFTSPPFDAAPSSVDVNPRVPPSGVVVYVYRADDLKVTFEHDSENGQLTSIAIEWG